MKRLLLIVPLALFALLSVFLLRGLFAGEYPAYCERVRRWL